MAWSTPATFTTGNVLTAAQMNTNLRDNTNFLHDPPGCQISRTSDTSIATGTTPAVLTLGIINYDTDSMTASPNRITITTAGVYNFSLNIEWAAQSGGSRLASIDEGLTISQVIASSFVSPAGTTASNSASGDFVCAAGYRFETGVWQNSGSTVAVHGTNTLSNVGQGNAPCYFSAHWIGAG